MTYESSDPNPSIKRSKNGQGKKEESQEGPLRGQNQRRQEMQTDGNSTC